MRTSLKTLRLTIAAVVAAVGLSILGIGVALAAPGKPAKPVKVSIKHERTSRDHSRGAHASRDKAFHMERSDRMRDR